MGKISLFGREFISWEKRSSELPVSNLKNPAEWLLQLLGLQTQAGVTITPDTALTLPVYYAGLKIIGEDIAKISGGVFKKEGNNRVPVNHPIGDLIFQNPNAIHNSFHWRTTTMIHALSWGNGYSLIIRDGNARPIELRLIIKPNDVEPYIIENELWYKVVGMAQPIPAMDMFHIRGIGYDGIKGRAILSVAKEIIGGGLAAQNYSNKTLAGDALKKIALVPGATGGKIGKVDPDVEAYIQEQWLKNTKSGKPNVLAPGLEVKEVGLNPAEIELISTQEFTVSQFSRITRIPPHKLMDLKNAHFNNIEHQSTEYVIDTLMPWIVQFELETRNKLFTEREKTDHYIKFNVNSLMRGDSAARSAYYHSMKLDGNMTGNEIRSLEEMNPLEGLDSVFTPVNVYTDELLEAQTQKVLEEVKKIMQNGNN